jgi:hypothetical protein
MRRARPCLSFGWSLAPSVLHLREGRSLTQNRTERECQMHMSVFPQTSHYWDRWSASTKNDGRHDSDPCFNNSRLVPQGAKLPTQPMNSLSNVSQAILSYRRVVLNPNYVLSDKNSTFPNHGLNSTFAWTNIDRSRLGRALLPVGKDADSGSAYSA